MSMGKDLNSLKRRFKPMDYESSLKRVAIYCFDHSSTISGFVQSVIFLSLVDFLDRNYGMNVDDMEEDDVDDMISILFDIYEPLIKMYHKQIKIRKNKEYGR